ncbi:bifunctional nicotinamide-nucleotide adenylyltransferase/Nudix hydroxylase [Sulfurirhabdus autotrophica]|uniref:Bifunctional NMN adenylyltransferase/nudix hydrolase n=1 Tax=Sulfurirhabdus autotrophica TaxID=1706046 RepID=A0A4R3XSK5_9PROT|nr:bifunctional nicotinamide-nucleotide adenylyltransferase/Nudix hydroxylase [Sulfurirhabdus autotrophica]TCV81226.1 bifunctional NMN adenylyltransferase/nudix hydrolase [Sulfurirhabdus autotrophica]
MNFDYIVYIGRFEPVHAGHVATLKKAAELGTHVIVLIGSAKQPRTIKNPWTESEREAMLSRAIQESGLNTTQFSFAPIVDRPYNDQQWVTEVQSAIYGVIHARSTKTDEGLDRKKSTIAIIGYDKDESSWYLNLFPQWKRIPMENVDGLHSTRIRSMLFSNGSMAELKDNLPQTVYNWLDQWMTQHPEELSQLMKEFKFIQRYKDAWKAAPYPPTFVTVDAVVIQSGHVLLVKRKTEPGKGLWALPGGFVDQNERLDDAVLRELKEETRLKVAAPILKGSIKATHVFDYPTRSLRGRTITKAYLIELTPGELPEIRGASDAEKAQWVPLSEFMNMQEMLFEDHHAIVSYFLGRV